MNNDNTLDINAIIAANKRLLEENARLANQHKLDEEEIQHLRELLSLRTRELFARKSEQNTDGGVQLSLFDDIELNKAIDEKEEEIEKCKEQLAELNNSSDIKDEQKKKKRKSINTDTLPVKIEEKHPTNLPKGAVLIGFKVKEKVCNEPSKLYKHIMRYAVYKVENDDGSCEFISDIKEDANTAFSNSIFDDTVVSEIIYNKTVLALPLYRQEQDFKRKGFNFSRQAMSSLVYKAYDAIIPITDRISSYIKNADNCRADETRMLIIENNGAKARIADPKKTETSYIWLFMTATGYHPAFSYVVGPSRKYENAKKFFNIPIAHRFLQTDDYGAYDKLPNTDRIPCLVHTKRKFHDANKSSKKEEYSTIAKKFVDMLSSISHEDNKIHDQLADKKGCDNYYDLIKEQRLITVKPLMDNFYAELDKVRQRVLPKSLLKTAVNYAWNYKELAYNFFLDGRLTLGNNEAEGSGIKSLVIGRKNWLFSKTVKGAEVTCAMYSLVKTAMANGLDPRKYLNFLLKNLPYKEMESFNYDDYLPWSDKIPEEIKVISEK